MKMHLLFAAAMILFSPLVRADDAAHYNRISFQSQATRKVDNDLLIARMSVEFNGPQPARIAQQIAATLKDAFKQADGYPAVKAVTGDQDTEPVYDKHEKLAGYRGSASIILKSRDFDAVAKLIAQLQDKMRLVGMDFTVSPELRSKVEGELTAEALTQFRKQADGIRGMLGGAGYKIVSAQISRGYAEDRQALMNNATPQDRLAFYKVLPMHGGQGEVAVQVAGTIEITP
jgi:predicted secreted protein